MPYHKENTMSVRGNLRETETLLKDLKAYRKRLHNASALDPATILDFEDQVNKAISQATAKVTELQTQIAWAQHRDFKSRS